MTQTYINLLNQAFDESLKDDSKVMLFGLGVGDVGAVFGSTKNLQLKQTWVEQNLQLYFQN